nr:unnamed protein product [Digitaria exilis]
MRAAAQRRHHRSFLAGDDAMRRHSRPLSFLFSPALATSTLPKIRRERAKIRWPATSARPGASSPELHGPPLRRRVRSARGPSRGSVGAPRWRWLVTGDGGRQARGQEVHAQPRLLAAP